MARPRSHGETLGQKRHLTLVQRRRDQQEASQLCLHEEKRKILQGLLHESDELVPDAVILVLLCVAGLLEERGHLWPRLKERREHQEGVGSMGWKASQVMPMDLTPEMVALLLPLLLGRFCTRPRRAGMV